MRVKKLH